MTKKVWYECVLKKVVSGKPYGIDKKYKKNTLIAKFTEKEFLKLTPSNIDKLFTPKIVEGHGVCVYFTWGEVEFIRCQEVSVIQKRKVKIKG